MTYSHRMECVLLLFLEILAKPLVALFPFFIIHTDYAERFRIVFLSKTVKKKKKRHTRHRMLGSLVSVWLYTAAAVWHRSASSSSQYLLLDPQQRLRVLTANINCKSSGSTTKAFLKMEKYNIM